MQLIWCTSEASSASSTSHGPSLESDIIGETSGSVCSHHQVGLSKREKCKVCCSSSGSTSTSIATVRLYQKDRFPLHLAHHCHSPINIDSRQSSTASDARHQQSRHHQIGPTNLNGGQSLGTFSTIEKIEKGRERAIGSKRVVRLSIAPANHCHRLYIHSSLGTTVLIT